MAIKLRVRLSEINEEQLTRLVLATNKLEREKAYNVFFSDDRLNRSSSQNRYLWGVVYKTISDATGYEPEDIHEMCKAKFSLRTKFNVYEAELIEFPRSTRLMDTKEMTDYIDAIRRWASEALNLHVPQPGEITDEAMIESKDYI